MSKTFKLYESVRIKATGVTGVVVAEDTDGGTKPPIYFVEKDNRTGVTDLYSLDEFAPRKNADIRRGYLQGRYGAIPAIGDGMEW